MIASLRADWKARRLAGRLPEDARVSAAARVAASAHAAHEAHLLWAGGELDAALGRAKDAVRGLLEVLQEAGECPPLAPALDAALRADAGSTIAGRWDVDEPLRVLLDERRRLAARARWLAFTPEAAAASIRRRWLLRAAVLVALLVLGWTALRPRATMTAAGSPGTQRNFEAIYAIDGNPRTEWQPDDHRGGWVELRLDPPRAVAALRVLNGHNRHYEDRATKDFEVAYYDPRGRRVARAEGRFDAIRPEGEWKRLDLAAADVARIRFTARTWHGRSPAVAELVVESRD